MRYYPAYLNLRHRNCLVVGGGRVAERKLKTLLACGARPTVVSPECRPQIHNWEAEGKIVLLQRHYKEMDLEGMFLVVGATDNPRVNRQISRNADQRQMLCNIADQPSASSFILPSVVHRGDLIIGISTSGTSPAMAKQIRKEMEKSYGSEYEIVLQLLGAVRKRLLQQDHHPERHRQVFQKLIDADLLSLIRQGRTADIDTLLAEVGGIEENYHQLMLSAE